MELRTAEEDVHEMRSQYNLLRENHGHLTLPPLLVVPLSPATTAIFERDGDVPSDAKTILSTLEGIREKLAEMEARLTKFQARNQSLDPITGKPRYGPATQARVTALLEQYGDLKQCVLAVFGEGVDTDTSNSDHHETPAAIIIDQVRLQAQQQEQADQQRRNEDQQRRESDFAMKQAQQNQLVEAERQRQREMEDQIERERQQRARQYEQTMLAKREARAAAEQADRQWLAGISRGPDGVREQLQVLLDATADDPQAQEAAIKSLHTIFKQIAAKPEEVTFRRIRRDHEKFNQDIGRHSGGREILIASGFELGAIDDVPCFISKEPDIERDMDGWSNWFELLNATLQIIAEHL